MIGILNCMYRIETYALGELAANCYIVYTNTICVVIDPGDSAEFIAQKIEESKCKLVAIVATHGHFDHIMAVGELQLSYPVPFFLHEKDMFLVQRVVETARHFLRFVSPVIPPQNIHHFSDILFKETCPFFSILHTSGHTPGSVCISVKNENELFCGDTIFEEGIGRYDFSYGSKKQLDASLETILKMPGETLLYPGHGNSVTIDQTDYSIQNKAKN